MISGEFLKVLSDECNRLRAETEQFDYYALFSFCNAICAMESSEILITKIEIEVSNEVKSDFLKHPNAQEYHALIHFLT